jgi:hypothetical protein
VELVFAGLSPLIIEEAVDEGELISVRARTPDSPTACLVAVRDHRVG